MKFSDLAKLGLIGFALAVSNPAFAEDQNTAYDKQQINCLAENIYFEAGNQSEAGKLAVSHVVMNRVDSKKFPATPCKVIKQKIGRVCQFSWVCRKTRIRDPKLFSESTKIATNVYYSKVSDNTNGSMFFHARSTRPSWARIFKRMVTIGDHVFYRK